MHSSTDYVIRARVFNAENLRIINPSAFVSFSILRLALPKPRIESLEMNYCR